MSGYIFIFTEKSFYFLLSPSPFADLIIWLNFGTAQKKIYFNTHYVIYLVNIGQFDKAKYHNRILQLSMDE